MAGTLTHAYFAVDAYSKFNKETKEKMKDYIENLKTYSQGHDILFFSVNYINYKKMKKIGNYLHKHNTREFFMNMISYIMDNNLQDNNEIISFLYGYIMHYALDSTVHPYVIYKTGIFKRNNKNTYKYNAKHSDLESYIDAYMIYNKENIKPYKFKFQKFCFNNNKISKDLSSLIDYVFSKTYNLKKMSIYFKQGLFNMKILYGIMRYDPYGIKKTIYKFIDKLLPKKIKKLYPTSLHYNLNNDNYYLNLDNNKWCHPRYSEETYTYSFIDLYNIAIDDSIKIINATNDVLFKNKNIDSLKNIFLNLSFVSGKDCNDRGKNKYFEF